MKTAKEYFDMGMERLKTLNPVPSLISALKYANEGAKDDVLNINGCANYQWGAALVDVWQPKQVVELGGAMGVWALCLLQYLKPENQLYSITLKEGGLEFSYVKDHYPNFHPIVGNDLDMENWEGVNLKQTDLWYIDTGIADDHFGEQLRKELDLYSPLFKRGSLILFDDIHKNEGMSRVWEELTRQGRWGLHSFYDATDPLHWTGYGLVVWNYYDDEHGET